MSDKNELPKRKRNRLEKYDYSTPGLYFVTICTHNRKCLLSHVVGAIHESPDIELTVYGKIVDRYINQIPKHYNTTVEQYVIMPNHIHLVLYIHDHEDKRAIRESPLRGRSILSKTIGYIKMNSSREIHNQFGNTIVWQRSFHDHVIRDHRDYEEIAKYVLENPIRWQYDCFYNEKSQKRVPHGTLFSVNLR